MILKVILKVIIKMIININLLVLVIVIVITSPSLNFRLSISPSSAALHAILFSDMKHE